MAFTTEFVMGAGGSVEVEEMPVSMSGFGSVNGTDYPLATFDAGEGAIVTVIGTLSGNGGTSTGAQTRPHLKIGSEVTHEFPHQAFTSGTGGAVAAVVSGSVTVSILAHSIYGLTEFDGTVYVARF